MADEPVVVAQPLGNEATVRDETGTIVTNPTPETKPETTPETKPESTEAKPEGEKKPAEAKPEAGKVPDAYALTAPEGYEIDAKVLEEVTPIFKELGLDNAQAQRLADVWNKHSIDAAKAVEDAVTAQRTSWRDEITKDLTLGDGKDGFKADVKKNIATAISQIGDAKAQADFKAAMDLTGAGDNPAFARAMNAFGKLLGEGTAVRGAGPSPEGQKSPNAGPRNAAQALFPNLPSSAS